MPVRVIYSESSALRKRLAQIAADAAPNSRKVSNLRTAVKKAVVEDNTEKLLSYGSGLTGVDRYGKTLAPLGDWAHGAAFLRRGNGPVLAPNGLQSRTITKFKVNWVYDGKQWRMVAGWSGVPWIIYHLRGAPLGSKRSQPNWSLPQRDIGGTTKKGFDKIRAAFRDFIQSVLRKES